MAITLVTVVHVFICIVLIGIVLLQHGKGADMGATFGGGGGTLFGASGADTLLTKVTTATAAAFMITSVYLAIDAREGSTPAKGRLFKDAPAQSAPAETAKQQDATAPAEAAKEAAPPAEKAQEPTAEQDTADPAAPTAEEAAEQDS